MGSNQSTPFDPFGGTLKPFLGVPNDNYVNFPYGFPGNQGEVGPPPPGNDPPPGPPGPPGNEDTGPVDSGAQLGGNAPDQAWVESGQPWGEWYSMDALSAAKDLWRRPWPKPYEGTVIPNFSKSSLDMMSRIEERGRSGSPLTIAGSSYLQDVLGGKYLNLNSNPYLGDYYNQAASRVSDNFRNSIRPSIDSQASLYGRYGSGIYRGLVSDARTTLGDTLTRLGTGMFGGAYQAERGYQQQALSLAPSVNAMRSGELSQALSVGQLREAKEQERLMEQKNKWDYSQNLPWTMMSKYSNILSTLNKGVSVQQPTPDGWDTGFNFGGAAGGGLMSYLLAMSNPVTAPFAIAGGVAGAVTGGL